MEKWETPAEMATFTGRRHSSGSGDRSEIDTYSAIYFMELHINRKYLFNKIKVYANVADSGHCTDIK